MKEVKWERDCYECATSTSGWCVSHAPKPVKKPAYGGSEETERLRLFVTHEKCRHDKLICFVGTKAEHERARELAAIHGAEWTTPEVGRSSARPEGNEEFDSPPAPPKHDHEVECYDC